MRKVILSTLMVLLSGCSEQGKYDGSYTCDVSQAANDYPSITNSKYAFPKTLTKADVIIKKNIMTIKGFILEDYVSGELAEDKKDNLINVKDKVTVSMSSDRKSVFLLYEEGDIPVIQTLTSCELKN
ncbi:MULTISPECIES: hypothetical protein [Proteus]|uniref:Lipoprotein n=2 Tax=Proteus TaxID=583 RepID=A0ABU6E9I1_9GAMM|nr:MULTISPECIES: hypothetical protein [Proteus]EIM6939838.1 hypothetical protein [Proteus mirabilis]EIO2231384.1 hypothetical protein [Proteus mirabilis]EJD6332460.1 hypothetical protein [Proteus mirabilis]EJD6351323.1 hypothetical protein [Proteus mirabilis]EJD6360342.1 hypothetical protein [Proteus mirabilis]